MTIKVEKEVGGSFAESKEQAKQVRMQKILPALNRGEEVILDFAGITFATQSFIHALIAEAVRVEEPQPGLDLLVFRNCAAEVKSIIEVVVSYAQDDWSDIVPDGEASAQPTT